MAQGALTWAAAPAPGKVEDRPDDENQDDEPNDEEPRRPRMVAPAFVLVGEESGCGGSDFVDAHALKRARHRSGGHLPAVVNPNTPRPVVRAVRPPPPGLPAPLRWPSPPTSFRPPRPGWA